MQLSEAVGDAAEDAKAQGGGQDKSRWAAQDVFFFFAGWAERGKSRMKSTT